MNSLNTNRLMPIFCGNICKKERFFKTPKQVSYFMDSVSKKVIKKE